MRLGAEPIQLVPDSLAHQIYQQDEIAERHRHRYEFNEKYLKDFEGKGFRFGGRSKKENLVEVIELEGHPWFVASQFHPEFKSKPDNAHPLFREFIRFALKKTKNEIGSKIKSDVSESSVSS